MNAEQALYDLYFFTEEVKTFKPNFIFEDIILFGYSFGGSLATWYQREFPNRAKGAFVSSAPVLGVADFKAAMEVSGDVVREYGGDSCYNRLEGAFNHLAELFDSNEYTQIREDLKICPEGNIENELGEWTLNGLLATELSYLASSTT